VFLLIALFLIPMIASALMVVVIGVTTPSH